MEVGGFAKVDFDGAVERARRIENEGERLSTLIQVATRVLGPNKRSPRIQFIGEGLPTF
jgi:hypothetical protein